MTMFKYSFRRLIYFIGTALILIFSVSCAAPVISLQNDGVASENDGFEFRPSIDNQATAQSPQGEQLEDFEDDEIAEAFEPEALDDIVMSEEVEDVVLSEEELETCHRGRKVIFCHMTPANGRNRIELCLPLKAVENRLANPQHASSHVGRCGTLL
jgi:hypothetical protein